MTLRAKAVEKVEDCETRIWGALQMLVPLFI